MLVVSYRTPDDDFFFPIFNVLLKAGASGMAAVGAAGVVIAGRVYYGWDVVSRVAETLPWIGAAFCLLNDLVDVVDTKLELEVNPFYIRLRCCDMQCYVTHGISLQGLAYSK